MSLDFQNMARSGYLMKEGGGTYGILSKGLKKRWMVLSGEKKQMYYAKDPTDEKALGIIELDGATWQVNEKKSKKKKKYCFEVATKTRTFYLFAESDEERQAWMKALDKATSWTEADLKAHNEAKLGLSLAASANAAKKEKEAAAATSADEDNGEEEVDKEAQARRRGRIKHAGDEASDSSDRSKSTDRDSRSRSNSARSRSESSTSSQRSPVSSRSKSASRSRSPSASKSRSRSASKSSAASQAEESKSASSAASSARSADNELDDEIVALKAFEFVSCLSDSEDEGAVAGPSSDEIAAVAAFRFISELSEGEESARDGHLAVDRLRASKRASSQPVLSGPVTDVALVSAFEFIEDLSDDEGPPGDAPMAIGIGSEMPKPSINDYKTQPWFFEDMNRTAAEEHLAGKPIRSFVVRPSSQPGCLSLTHIEDTKTPGHGIIYYWDGSRGRGPGWSIEQSTKTYGSVGELLLSLPLRHDDYALQKTEPTSAVRDPRHESPAVKLYYDALSAESQAILLLLEVNSVPWSGLRFASHAQRTDEAYCKLNPRKTLPALVDVENDEFTLVESAAMLKYVVRRCSLPEHWYPRDTPQRARVDQCLEWRSRELGEGWRELIAAAQLPVGGDGNPTARRMAIDAALFGPSNVEASKTPSGLLSALERLGRVFLANGKRDFIGDRQPSIADLAVWSDVSVLTELLGIDAKMYKGVSDWYDRMDAMFGHMAYRRGFVAALQSRREQENWQLSEEGNRVPYGSHAAFASIPVHILGDHFEPYAEKRKSYSVSVSWQKSDAPVAAKPAAAAAKVAATAVVVSDSSEEGAEKPAAGAVVVVDSSDEESGELMERPAAAAAALGTSGEDIVSEAQKAREEKERVERELQREREQLAEEERQRAAAAALRREKEEAAREAREQARREAREARRQGKAAAAAAASPAAEAAVEEETEPEAEKEAKREKALAALRAMITLAMARQSLAHQHTHKAGEVSKWQEKTLRRVKELQVELRELEKACSGHARVGLRAKDWRRRERVVSSLAEEVDDLMTRQCVEHRTTIAAIDRAADTYEKQWAESVHNTEGGGAIGCAGLTPVRSDVLRGLTERQRELEARLLGASRHAAALEKLAETRGGSDEDSDEDDEEEEGGGAKKSKGDPASADYFISERRTAVTALSELASREDAPRDALQKLAATLRDESKAVKEALPEHEEGELAVAEELEALTNDIGQIEEGAIAAAIAKEAREKEAKQKLEAALRRHGVVCGTNCRWLLSRALKARDVGSEADADVDKDSQFMEKVVNEAKSRVESATKIHAKLLVLLDNVYQPDSPDALRVRRAPDKDLEAVKARFLDLREAVEWRKDALERAQSTDVKNSGKLLEAKQGLAGERLEANKGDKKKQQQLEERDRKVWRLKLLRVKAKFACDQAASVVKRLEMPRRTSAECAEGRTSLEQSAAALQRGQQEELLDGDGDEEKRTSKVVKAAVAEVESALAKVSQREKACVALEKDVDDFDSDVADVVAWMQEKATALGSGKFGVKTIASVARDCEKKLSELRERRARLVGSGSGTIPAALDEVAAAAQKLQRRLFECDTTATEEKGGDSATGGKALSEQERADWKECFDHFDKDNNSYLSAEEVKNCVSALGYVISTEDQTDLLAENDGKVHFDAFCDFIVKRESAPVVSTSESIKSALQTISNGKERVSYKELKRVLGDSLAHFLKKKLPKPDAKKTYAIDECLELFKDL